MSGLREQQKALRRRTISQSALTLFAHQGFQATTMEQIARTAAVSVPTVFAYFGSKQEILLEKLHAADRRAIAEARERIAQYANPLDAICDFQRRLTEYAFEVMPPALWREILPPLLPLLGPDQSALPEAYKRVNDALVQELTLLLGDLCSAGLLRATLDIEYAAFMLNDYGHLQLLRLCTQSEPDKQTFWADTRRSTAFMLSGMQ
ncbi:TetR/AcrR family transcriptional regulator [Scandinavium manionii]|uniref:TetR/AcrR family transcriptional regulator n=1 Tax=Scandinavium manionii TaxID=2926520 RepID=UPI0013591A0E|nr:TetR/AcrR family transcriptional regulator [Scandinavium manionii]MCS2149967.1 TetR/AcrR family transcriptional regulator [Scandinavium manionii]MCS2168345.1 TetR/AcrR family transcriptional regulator [Scandinavium manionii]